MRIVKIFRKNKLIAEGELLHYEDDADLYIANVEWWAKIKIIESIESTKLIVGRVYSFRRSCGTSEWRKTKDRQPCLGAVQIRDGNERL